MGNGYDRLEAEWSFTDQEREHYDYEFNAQFDRFDGWADVDYSARFDYESCPTCGYAVPYCTDCEAYRAELTRKYRAEQAARATNTDCDDSVPF